MNRIQKFVKNEKNIRRLMRVFATDECEECPAFKFCKRYKESEDCSDAFVAWALTEVKSRGNSDETGPHRIVRRCH